jgi:hypothetical protein
MLNNLHVLKQNNKHIVIKHRNIDYIIGFPNVIHARKVQYDMDIVPSFSFVRDTLSPSHDLDVKATLFIDKSPPGSNVSGLLDGNITMDTYKDRDFYELLLIENKGLIIPYDLKEEDNDEFMFRSFIIDP